MSPDLHFILLLRNAPLDTERATAITASVVFLQSRKQWNHTDTDASPPENVVFEAIHRLRRRVVTWLMGASQREVDAMGDAAVRVSAMAGVMKAKEGEHQQRWARVTGERAPMM